MPADHDPVTDDGVLAALLAACPGIRVRGLERSAGGYSAEHWLADTDEGRLLVTLPRRGATAEDLRALVAATRLAAEAGVPVPRLRALVAHDARVGGPMLVLEYRAGQAATARWPALPSAGRYAVAHRFGQLVAALHDRTGTRHADVLGREPFADIADTARARTRAALSALEGTVGIEPRVLAATADRLLRTFDRLAADDRAAGTPPSLLHRDLYLDNLVLDGDRIVLLTDFEHARFGDPAEDFGKLDELVFGWYPETREPFLAGYRTVRPWDGAFERRVHAHIGLYNLTMCAYFRRWQPDLVPGYLERIAAWLDSGAGADAGERR